MDKYTELEKQAQKFLDETDTMQFSTVELLTMFYNHQEQLRIGGVGCSLPSEEEIKREANKYSDINGIICADENWIIDKHEAFIDGAEFIVNRMK